MSIANDIERLLSDIDIVDAGVEDARRREDVSPQAAVSVENLLDEAVDSLRDALEICEREGF